MDLPRGSTKQNRKNFDVNPRENWSTAFLTEFWSEVSPMKLPANCAELSLNPCLYAVLNYDTWQHLNIFKFMFQLVQVSLLRIKPEAVPRAGSKDFTVSISSQGHSQAEKMQCRAAPVEGVPASFGAHAGRSSVIPDLGCLGRGLGDCLS